VLLEDKLEAQQAGMDGLLKQTYRYPCFALAEIGNAVIKPKRPISLHFKKNHFDERKPATIKPANRISRKAYHYAAEMPNLCD